MCGETHRLGAVQLPNPRRAAPRGLGSDARLLEVTERKKTMSDDNSVICATGGVRSFVRTPLAAIPLTVSALLVPGCRGVDPSDHIAYARALDRTEAVVTDYGGLYTAVAGSFGLRAGDDGARREAGSIELTKVRCKVTWRAGSSICKDGGKTGSCTATWEGKHATLDAAKKECERQNQLADDPEAVTCSECRWVTQAQSDCLDHCKDLCVEIWEGCYDKCGKDHVCKEKCMRELIACNQKCEEKCK
jgi:hypothetical protein